MKIDKGNRIIIFWGVFILSFLGSKGENIFFIIFLIRVREKVKDGVREKI